MSRIIRILVAALAAWAASAQAESFSERYEALKTKGTREQIDALLQEWIKAEPDKPDGLIAAANYWWAEAGGIQLAAGPAKPGEFALKDKDGKEVGHLAPAKADDTLRAKAIGFLRDASAKFPLRLDIWCGLAYLLQESGQPDEQLKALQALVAQVKKADVASLRWKNEPIKEDLNDFMCGKLHAYALVYFRQETPEGDAVFGKIATLMTEEYPKNPMGWNDLALYQHLALKDTKKALASSEKALELAPDDMLVEFNIGKFAVLCGEKDKARRAFRNVVAKSKEEEMVASARKELEGLDHSGTKKP